MSFVGHLNDALEKSLVVIRESRRDQIQRSDAIDVTERLSGVVEYAVEPLMRPERKANDELVVFRIRSRDSTCSDCGDEIGRGGLLRKEGERGLCLDCADLGDLEFLPAGDPAITRRASRYSRLRAVVVEWSRSRKRYERQGILAQPAAIARAEEESLADEPLRERRKLVASVRRNEIDRRYVQQFAEAIRRHYPGAGKGEENRIAEHACRKYSGRVGRSAAAKELDPEMIELAVRAYIRHTHTDYEDLLMQGWERGQARAEVRQAVDDIVERWQKDPTVP